MLGTPHRRAVSARGVGALTGANLLGSSSAFLRPGPSTVSQTRMTHPTAAPRTPAPRRAPSALMIGVVAVLIALAMLALAGLGSRWGLWSFRTGFTLLRYATYGAIAGSVVTLIGVILAARHRSTRGAAAIGAVVLAMGLVAATIPMRWRSQARSVPPIHDITTDTEDPPTFQAVLPLRGTESNSVDYPGDTIARQQRAAYPDVQAARLPVAPDVAFGRAHAAARDLGWSIVEADSAAGRIEASDRTAWFGFTDDVVIRVRADPAGSRVDIRSVSRVGGSDVGANAARIRRFLTALNDGGR